MYQKIIRLIQFATLGLISAVYLRGYIADEIYRPTLRHCYEEPTDYLENGSGIFHTLYSKYVILTEFDPNWEEIEPLFKKNMMAQ
ncbi:hypothetical protein OAF74_03410 [bacterium]|nr:hypothetical protein [bacterium]